ncbi:MAG TPA: GAF domain-containing sensor histidine kinase [Ferruginibacter sp.]|nr:GAF domain-containing sensor histidine kinase [Ferruginibacter sp.]
MIQENHTVEFEAMRMHALRKYNILDTPPNPSFDRITKLAAKLFHVPIAMISLVDTDRIWFKSRFGIDIAQIDRDLGLCSLAIQSDDIYLMEDAIKDSLTATNPYVSGQCGLRFYAAAPLKVKGGYNIGTLCIMDRRPRHLEESQKEVLHDLAEILINQIEFRLATKIATEQQNQLLNIAVHDLRNPLTTIPLWIDLIKEEKRNHTAVIEMSGYIKKAALKMTKTINELLESAALEANQIKLSFSELNLVSIVQKVVDANQILASAKNQALEIYIEDHPTVYADETKLIEIVDNLLNNAIKYSAKHKDISIRIKQVDEKAIIEVVDQGLGFTKEDKKNVFESFSKLSSKPTGEETSSGLGLFIVKLFVEAHKGKIFVESEGKNKGSKFTVEMPVVYKYEKVMSV